MWNLRERLPVVADSAHLLNQEPEHPANISFLDQIKFFKRRNYFPTVENITPKIGLGLTMRGLRGGMRYSSALFEEVTRA
jgi:hypothetical protein